MQTPVDFERPFCEHTLHDWWRWQKQHDTVHIPHIWLATQHSLDLWFHMFSLAQKTQPDYLHRLIESCVQAKEWSFQEMCASLNLWNESRNFLEETLLFKELLSVFNTTHPLFSRAVVLCGLQSKTLTPANTLVLHQALNIWNEHTPLTSDPLIKWQTWDLCKFNKISGAGLHTIEYLSNYFQLEDFLYLIVPNSSQNTQERNIYNEFKRVIKNQYHTTAYTHFFEDLNLHPSFQAFQNFRQWPIEKITFNSLNALVDVHNQLLNHRYWNDNSEFDWFLRDWKTEIVLKKQFCEPEDTDENRGKRGKRKI